MAKRIKLVVSKGYPPDLGGVQTYSYEIAQAYRRLGYRSYVLTSRPGVVGVTKEDGVCVINVGLSFQALVALKMFICLIVLRQRSNFRHSIAHATTWRVAFPLSLLRWNFVLTIHGREILATKGLILSKVMNFTLHSARRIVAISKFSLEKCVPIQYSQKAIYSWNGASNWAIRIGQERDYAGSSITKDDEIKIIFAARFVRRKNVIGSIIAFKRFLDIGGRGSFFVAGDGADKVKAEKIVDELDLVGKVHFVGHLRSSELSLLYAESDVLLHPHTQSHDETDVETFCLTVADGMASGLAVISGSDGAPSEYLASNLGIAVNGTNIDEIASALIKLYENAPLRYSLGKSAARFALENFSWDVHVRNGISGLGE